MSLEVLKCVSGIMQVITVLSLKFVQIRTHDCKVHYSLANASAQIHAWWQPRYHSVKSKVHGCCPLVTSSIL